MAAGSEAPLVQSLQPRLLSLSRSRSCSGFDLPASAAARASWGPGRVPRQQGRYQRPQPLSCNPRAAAHICLVFYNPPLHLLPASSPPFAPSIPFGFPHFSLEWVSYPRLDSGLTLLNTNKTHSTQVEQGARARVTNGSPASKHSCKSPLPGPEGPVPGDRRPADQHLARPPRPSRDPGRLGGSRVAGGREGPPGMFTPVAVAGAAGTAACTGPRLQQLVHTAH